jgi:hypothetical protein
MTVTITTPGLNLLADDMAAATPIALQPYAPGPAEFGWDVAARIDNPASGPGYRRALSFTAVEGKQYAFRAIDGDERPLMMVFNERGEGLAMAYGSSADHSAFLHDFIAPYSGTFYLSPLVTPRSNAASVRVFADLDTGPLRDGTLLAGGAGNDKLFSTMGADQVDGGAGRDLLAYPGDRAAYKIINLGESIAISAVEGFEGGDTVRNVEQLAFADTTIELGYSTLATSLYLGYFGRAADPAGLRAFQSQLAALGAPDNASELSGKFGSDAGIRSLIDSFGGSAESQALYPGVTRTFVEAIYQNLFKRAPDQAGLDFWSSAIDAGHLSRANAALAILGGAQANSTAQGVLDKQTIAHKVSVAWNFTSALDMPAEIALYNSAAAAATARELLSTVSANTDIARFQINVDYAILSLAPARASAAPAPADAAPPAHDLHNLHNLHELALELSGVAAQAALPF